MRALKLLTSFVTWRWTPCIGLIASSVLYVVIVVLVTPKTLSFGGGPKAVNVIEGGEPTNAMAPAAPRTDRGAAGARRPSPAPQGPTPLLIPAPTPPPAPATPAEEPRRPETPPPVVTPPPAPPPNTDQAGEDDEATAPPPPAAPAPNPNARFMATPLRFLPQLASAAGAAQPPPPPAEDH